METGQNGHFPFDRKTLLLAVSIFVLLTAIYSLTYSGTFVTDDEHILAARSISLTYDELINNDRVIGNSRVYELSQLPPEAMSIEPGQAFLGVPLLYLANILDTGQVQTLFLMNIWVTSFSAVVLFFTVLIFGYSNATALVTALFFGLGTIAWPYTRTFFRDSLAMFFLLAAWFFLELSLKKGAGGFFIRNPAWSRAGFSIALLAGILTKNTIVIALPVILCRLLFPLFAACPKIQISRVLTQIWKPATGLVLLSIGWFLFTPAFELLGRFTYKYYSYLARFFTTIPHPGLLEAIAGPLASPGKSVFLFSPILILSFAGLIMRWRTAWFGWLYLLLLLIGQGLFYDGGWAGIVNWGLRYILPAIPLLMIGSAPVVDSWIKSAKGKLGLLFLAVISAAIQLAGVLTPVKIYYFELGNMNPSIPASASIWEPGYSILLWSFRWLFEGRPFDIAIVRMGGQTIWIVAGFAIAILLAAINFKAVQTRIAFASLGLALGLSIGMLAVYRADPAWHQARPDLQAARSTISQEFLAGDTVLIKSYGSPAWDYWMNWSDSAIPFTALPFTYPNPNNIFKYRQTHNPADALDAISIKILNEATRKRGRIWLILPYDSPAADLNLEVEWLGEYASRVQLWKFTDNEKISRLFLFEDF